MSHPAQLIAKIRTLLESEYPCDLYRYQIEKSIPGTRMLPDILIMTRSGQMQCAVEIGYTRPEKLSAYRKIHHIPDVRWYDKHGNLHSDVAEKTVRVKVKAAPEGTFSLWTAHESVACVQDNCDSWDVVTAIITDFWFVWLINRCQACHGCWLSEPMDMGAFQIIQDFKTTHPLELRRTYERHFRGGWALMAETIEKACSLDLAYEDGIGLREGHGSPRQAIEVIRTEERA